ncbi:MAG: hypothetical protein LBI19_10910 [Oscillospiraceae bacterium]|jgi:hypothetical protein|nr:hypothetical protein [Oscillospiraceae bacterium]
MTVEKIDNIALPAKADVTLKLCGNVAEIKYVQHTNSKPRIEKIDKDNYVVLGTGEVREFQHTESRKDDLQSVKESLGRLRDYLNTNVVNVKYCRFLTLTYRDEMTDPARLYRDYKAFNRKCRKMYGHYEYIVAAEVQRPRTPGGSGVLHLHCVLIFKGKAPFMDNKTVAGLWGQGFVNIRAVRNVADVGRYLTAYLTDIPLEDVGKMPADLKPGQLKNVKATVDGVEVEKSIIKGYRLKYLPPGFNLYRVSSKIKPPSISRITGTEADSLLQDWKLTYQSTYRITDESRDFDNIVSTLYFNKLLGQKEKAMLEKARQEMKERDKK